MTSGVSPCSVNPFSGINEQQRRGMKKKKINGDCIVSGKLEKIPNQITKKPEPIIILKHENYLREFF